MRLDRGKYAADVRTYVQNVIDGKIVANRERVKACRRFAEMTENPEYEVRTKDADFVIGIIEATFKHTEGTRLDGNPLGGKPPVLEPWQGFRV